MKAKHAKLIKQLPAVTIAIALSTQSSWTFAADKPIKVSANIGYVNVNTYPILAQKVGSMRLSAIRETATHLGASGALAYRSVQINCALNKEAYYLDHTFNFNRILLPHHVLPPVIVEANNSLKLSDPTTIRGDQKTYRIIKPARFITTPPTWRDYLFMNYPKPTLPDNSLLPTNKTEAIAWNTFLKQGWKQGTEQANEIFQENMDRLKQDYKGMITFRKLLSEHMVSAPYVSHAKIGITGNATELRIDDQITRIVSPAQLQPDSKKWQAIPY